MLKKVREEIIKDKQPKLPKPKGIPEGKTCSVCRCVLVPDNITQNRIDKYTWVCTPCNSRKLANIDMTNYRHAVEKDAYDVVRDNHHSYPRVAPKNIESYESNYELLTDTIKDTEKYRIERMFSIMHGTRRNTEDKDRKAAVNYLLKMFDKLTRKQCVSVINVINKMLGDSKVSADIQVKLASELKAFLGDGKSKDSGIQSYEQTLKNGGMIEIDD